MYHKKPDQQDMTLAEWNKKQRGKIVEIKHEEAKPTLDNLLPNRSDSVQDKMKRAVNKTSKQINEATDKARFVFYGGREMTRPSKKQSLINKLKLEKNEYLDKLVKMDDEIIDSDELSEGQRGLLKIQRSAMKTIINVLDLRIKDLED